MEDLKSLQYRKKEIEKELRKFPYISIFNDDGEVDVDAYQEVLEQNYCRQELQNEIKDIDSEIISFGATVEPGSEFRG